MTQPFVSPLYRPGLNGPKSTAHEYLSFPLLLCLSNESSRYCQVGWAVVRRCGTGHDKLSESSARYCCYQCGMGMPPPPPHSCTVCSSHLLTRRRWLSPLASTCSPACSVELLDDKERKTYERLLEGFDCTDAEREALAEALEAESGIGHADMPDARPPEPVVSKAHAREIATRAGKPALNPQYTQMLHHVRARRAGRPKTRPRRRHDLKSGPFRLPSVKVITR